MDNLPQWLPQRLHHFTHAQPQWGDLDVEIGNRDTMPDDQLCAGCSRNIKSCKCTTCFKCKTSVGIGSRHHCRRCWRTTCSACRKRQRYLNPFSLRNTVAPVCDLCARYRAIPRLTDSLDYLGVYLLRQSADLPRRCISVTCQLETYDLECPSCAMPTVTTVAHVERVVRVRYCCKGSTKCPKCSNVEQRMAREEEDQRLKREALHASLTPALEEEMLDSRKLRYGQAFDGVEERLARQVYLAAVAASVCYEYDFFPHTTLALNDAQHAKLLLLKETRQAYSVFVGPSKTVYVAFPGTHDLRTTITDIKFGRVTRTEWGRIHDGLRADPTTQRPTAVSGPIHKLWEYKIHEGFADEEAGLRKVLPTSVCRNYIQQGYSVVFCGHSLGGALAALTCLRHLTDDVGTFAGRCVCITFGAPLIANSSLTRKIQRMGWSRYFQHLVYKSDIVPRLLTGRKLPQEAVEKVQDSVASAFSSAKGAVLTVLRKAPIVGQRVSAGADDAAQTDRSATTVEIAQGGEESDECTISIDQHQVDECFRDAPAMVDDASITGGADLSVPQLALVQGPKRSFDCYGRYHFLRRDVPYKSFASPDDAYVVLKRGDGLSVVINDHLLHSYTRALAWHLRRQ